MKVKNNILIKVENSDIKNGQFVFPEGISSIGNSAFYQCSDLISIIIPKGVTYIDFGAFSDCTGLTSIIIPEDVNYIGSAVFSGCSNLASIELPKGITVIGIGAFMDCNKLTSVVIPYSVVLIANNAFSSCINLTSMIIPEGVTEIRREAFYNCSNLISVTIPDSVMLIASTAFKGCTALTAIYIEAKTLENFERILAFLPEDLQKKIHSNYKEFIEKAWLLFKIGKQNFGFFGQTEFPLDVTSKLVVNLAKEYDISPLMLKHLYQKFGIPSENILTIEPSFGFGG